MAEAETFYGQINWLVKIVKALGNKQRYYHYHETYPVENIHPAFQGDTLEGSEHCQHKVVEVGDPKIGPL